MVSAHTSRRRVYRQIQSQTFNGRSERNTHRAVFDHRSQRLAGVAYHLVIYVHIAWGRLLRSHL